MSTKGNKRRQKRVNTHDEDTSEVEKLKKEEKTEQNGSSTPQNASTEVPEKLETSEPLVEENGDSSDLKGFAASEIVNIETIQVIEDKDEVIVVDPDAKTNGDEVETVEVTLNSQVSVTDSQKSSKDDTESELEPLVLDSEDPELQFPETASDISDLDKSPVITRCATRRSQTRNIPTPKTPRTPRENGDDRPDEEADASVTPEVVMVEEDKATSADSTLDASFESADRNTDAELDNASVLANCTGNDTTRNMADVTAQLDEPAATRSFSDKSYSDILRNLSGRRMLRPHGHEHSLRHELHKSYTFGLERTKDSLDARRYSPLRTSALKRKMTDGPADDGCKRFRDDASPSLLSYISSPIHSFRSRLTRSELPSSTPKLTAFKYTHRPTAVDELTKADDAGPQIEPKKWCSIM